MADFDHVWTEYPMPRPPRKWGDKHPGTWLLVFFALLAGLLCLAAVWAISPEPRPMPCDRDEVYVWTEYPTKAECARLAPGVVVTEEV